MAFVHAWTTRELADSVARLQAGASPDDVAGALGVSRRALKQAVSRAGHDWRAVLDTPRRTRDAQIVAKHKAGTPAAALAADHGLSTRAIWKIVHAQVGDGNRRRRKHGSSAARRLVGLRLEGQGYHAIAANTGVPVGTVRRTVRRYADEVGIKTVAELDLRRRR